MRETLPSCKGAKEHHPGIRRWAVCGAMSCLFGVAWLLAAHATGSQRLVAPADGNFGHGAIHTNRVLVVAYGNRDFQPSFELAAGFTATLELPRLEGGYELTLIGHTQRGAHEGEVRVPQVLVGVNGHRLGDFAQKFPARWNQSDVHGARFVISGELLAQPTNLVTFTLPSRNFRGRMVVSRHPAQAAVARLLLPVAAWLLLSSLAWFLAETKNRRLFAAALPLVFFAVYSHSLATMKIAAFADYFFSDPKDLIQPVTRGAYIFDLTKHPLFQPVARPLYVLLHALSGRSEVVACALLFALAGAFAVGLAWLVFRRWCARPRTAALLAVLYGFSFSTWIFASHIETYIFCAAAANGFLLAMLARDCLSQAAGVAIQGMAGAVAALMHPPLMILNAVSIARMGRRGGRHGMLREAAIAFAVLVIYVAGSGLIRAASGPFADAHKAASESSGLLASELATFSFYADRSNATRFHAGNVIAGQCFYALVGQKFPAHWSEGLGGLRRVYRRGIVGFAAALAVAALWAVGLSGLARDLGRRGTSLRLFALVLLPYLLFFWFFNPAEMFLYSAPFLSLLLAWLCRGWENMLAGARLDGFLLVCGAVIMLHNAACVASYP
jgi:hypothetical protein